MTILIPTLILVGIAIVCAALLTLASVFFGVKEEYGTSHIAQVHRFYFGSDDEIKRNVAEALKTQNLIKI